MHSKLAKIINTFKACHNSVALAGDMNANLCAKRKVDTGHWNYVKDMLALGKQREPIILIIGQCLGHLHNVSNSVDDNSRSKSLHAQHPNLEQDKKGNNMDKIKDPRKTKSYSTLSRIPLTPKLARLFHK